MTKRRTHTKKQMAAYRANGMLGGAPKQPESMRQLIHSTLLDLMADGSMGTVQEICERVEIEATDDYNPNTIKVQTSQVRNAIFEKVGVDRPKKRGMITKADREALEKQLRKASVKRKIAELQASSG